MGRQACRRVFKEHVQKRHGRKSLPQLVALGTPLLFQAQRRMRSLLYVCSVAKPSIISPT
ncbi:hypothetical protein LEMLEM_LOCUS5122 [Lemmus lemmus]